MFGRRVTTLLSCAGLLCLLAGRADAAGSTPVRRTVLPRSGGSECNGVMVRTLVKPHKTALDYLEGRARMVRLVDYRDGTATAYFDSGEVRSGTIVGPGLLRTPNRSNLSPSLSSFDKSSQSR
jgi:hypothetical protein